MTSSWSLNELLGRKTRPPNGASSSPSARDVQAVPAARTGPSNSNDGVTASTKEVEAEQRKGDSAAAMEV